MKVADCIIEQDKTNGKSLFLIQQGLFFHAYGQCAVFMQAVTGYQIRQVRLHGSTIEQLGIPCNAIDGVLNRTEQRYPDIKVERQEKHYHLVLTDGYADAIPYEKNIQTPPVKSVPAKHSTLSPTLSTNEQQVLSRLRSLDISNVTPLQAINLLSEFHTLLK